jgi:hypothetical protein
LFECKQVNSEVTVKSFSSSLINVLNLIFWLQSKGFDNVDRASASPSKSSLGLAVAVKHTS